MIEAHRVTKSYGSTMAVDDLSFQVRSGHVTGFLGPNGAGKSTTMRVILGLDRPFTLVQESSYLLLLAAAVSTGLLLRARKVIRDQEMDRARKEERLALARDVHDTVAHHMTGIIVQAQASRHVAERDPTAAVRALEQIEHAGSEALTAMRRVVTALRDDASVPRVPQEFRDALEDLTGPEAACPSRAGQGTNAEIPAEVSATVLRVAREALTNARRHARGATGIDVAVHVHPDHVTLNVSDDGGGASPAGRGRLRARGHRRTCEAAGWAVQRRPDRRPGLARANPPSDEPETAVSMRVLIADDQEMVRAGFRLILAGEPDIDVVAEVGDGVSALERAWALRPDVCLLDIRMPAPDGLEVTRRLAGPDVRDPLKVVVVTTFDLDEYVHDALTSGVSGFLLEDAGAAWAYRSGRMDTDAPTERSHPGAGHTGPGRPCRLRRG